ncbi:unnamed protein product [Calicophoron daubneyi]|uniref:microtubule-severing ATPase n=1 Tax=Calicophoron daubneyi TaxID=300641 RepID=A0AAV2TFS5_CALDB
MVSDYYREGKKALSSAINAEDRNSYTEARGLYVKCVSYFEQWLRSPSDRMLIAYAQKFRNEAMERINFIDNRSKGRAGGAVAATTRTARVRRCPPEQSDMKSKLKNVDEKLADRILSEVYEDCSSITFDDIIGNEKAKQTLKETVILPALRPELFTGLRSPVRGVLLFGPPGNGKTMLAKAVASESNCTFFNITAASLLSKWVGESENLVRALFAVARQHQPAIIFIDEVDSMMTARQSGSGHDVSRRVLTQLLTEIDGVGSDSDRLLILGATNRPEELDSAALRRFSKRIYVSMPDANARTELLQKLLSKNPGHSLSKNDLRKIATNTAGYSASDLRRLAEEAALEPVRELGEKKLRTIAPRDVRPIKVGDFLRALRTILPSVAPSDLVPYEKWNAQFGESPPGAQTRDNVRRNSSLLDKITLKFQ